MELFYSPAYVAAAGSFDTTRKARWLAERLCADSSDAIRLRPPEPLTQDQLCAVHDPRYVCAVRAGQPRELAESQDLRWDEQIWIMACAQNGGVLAAARAAMRDGVSGSLSSGLHHARRARGAGFCTFNGLALGAHMAMDEGARAVLILDLDAHCGGGTYSLAAGEPRIWHVDVATSDYDAYAPGGHHTLDLVTDAGDYLPSIQARLQALERHGPHFDLCLYNAGMDPCEDCDVGGLRNVTRAMLAERETLIFDWCCARSIPIAFVLAGGYTGPRLDVPGLVDLHSLTISAASEVERNSEVTDAKR